LLVVSPETFPKDYVAECIVELLLVVSPETFPKDYVDKPFLAKNPLGRRGILYYPVGLGLSPEAC
jgi:hypothetical protein